jgi:hypothetical protein
MSQQRQSSFSRREDDEANTPLLPRNIPGANNKSKPKLNASRSFPQRNSHYDTFDAPTNKGRAKPKQPMRTTKISQKLKLFPEDNDNWNQEEPEEAEVYNQIAKIPHGIAREEAEMLNKMDRSELSRMTAYCTAS